MKNHRFNIIMGVILAAFFLNMAEVHYYTLNRNGFVQEDLGRTVPFTGNYNKVVYLSRFDLALIGVNYVVGGLAVIFLIVLIKNKSINISAL